MIKITDMDRRENWVAAEAIARITEAGVSSQWHGVMAIVKLFDGTTIEAREDHLSLAAAVGRERAGS